LFDSAKVLHTVVSIHAPARGATYNAVPICYITSSFNPRPRAGGDIIRIEISMLSVGFNPRPRAGGDHIKRVGLQT